MKKITLVIAATLALAQTTLAIPVATHGSPMSIHSTMRLCPECI